MDIARRQRERHVRESRLALILLTAIAVLFSVLAPASADDDDDDDDDVPPVYPLDSFPPSPSDNAILKWNEEALECIRETKPGPTVVARSLAVVHTATYDAWAAYDSRAVGARLGGSLRRPTAERTLDNKSRAISHAAYLTLTDLFPACRTAILERWTGLGYPTPEQDTSTAARVGRQAAQAVIDYRRTDRSNQANRYADTTGYTPVNTADTITDPWRWQPLRVPTAEGGSTVQTALTPQWRYVTPFALTSRTQFTPAGPSRDPSRTTRDILNESANLNDRKKVIAEYWADGPRSELPPGHWNLFAQWVSRRRGHTIDQDARMFFALDNAMLDASIACWEAKYRWDFARPVTAIRGTLAGQTVRAWGGEYQGTRQIRAEDWRPYQQATVVSPPFPEFTSGHSTFSAAGARVLRSFTGSDTFGASVTIRAGTSFVEPRTNTQQGVPAADLRLTWSTYTAAADEAGISRRYGGIHFLDADLQARSMGRSIGDQAYGKARGYWEGAAGSGDDDDDDDD